MKQLLSSLCLLTSHYLIAQNVGIGTTAPAAKLEISSSALLQPSLLITDSAYKGLGNLRFQSIDYAGKYMQLHGYKASPWSQETYLYVASDSVNIATFKGDGSVGINTGSPTEKLDVHGNINLTGTIKANGTDGNPNQVLMKNADGKLGWGDVNGTGNTGNEYSNVAIFFATGSGASQSWLVPDGISSVSVELWGGGGSGGSHSGGGGGGYVRGKFTVDAGKSLTIVIGLGGNPALVPGGNPVPGQETTVGNSGTTLHAYGGLAASESFADGYPLPAGGFYGVTGSAFLNYFGVPGESGSATTEFASQYSATEFRRIEKKGNGGDAGNSSNTGGKGGQAIYLLPGGGTFDAALSAPAQVPGGGGAARPGNPGAAGLVLIHY